MDYRKTPEKPLPLVEISAIMNSDTINKYPSPPSFINRRIMQILESINYFVNKSIQYRCSLTSISSLKLAHNKVPISSWIQKVIDSFVILSKVRAYSLFFLLITEEIRPNGATQI